MSHQAPPGNRLTAKGAPRRGPIQAVFPLPDATAAESSRVARYEDLEGGKGREIFFRPMRYGPSDLGSVQPVVQLILESGTLQCRIVDVSQNGLAFHPPAGAKFQTGDRLAQVSVKFDQHEAYRGEARVVSVRTVDGATVVGVSFNDSLMSIEDVIVMRDVKAWAGDGSTGLALRGRPWYIPGHELFKARTAELRLFLEDAQKQLADLEASLPFQVVHEELKSPARAALLDRIRKEFVPPVVRFSEEIDAAMREAAPEDTQALKEYSLRQVNSFLMLAPWMSRSFHKPLGYPGDFEVMRYVYERSFWGPTLFAKAISLAFLETKPAKAVRSRKDFIKAQLRRCVSNPRDSGRPIRILSVAAGPAQEVYELLGEIDDLPAPLVIVLFDQEKQALTHAYTRLKRLVDSRWPRRVTIVYWYDTIKRLIGDDKIFDDWGRFDFIFACGLFDYLQFNTAATLSRNLYRCLGAGGSLYVGNMTPANPGRWFMEYHLDWFLTYRSHAEMLAFARKGVPDGQISIAEEETGINPFAVLTRP